MTIVVDFETQCAKYRKKAINEAIDFAYGQLMSRMKLPIYINIRPIRNLAEKKGIHGDIMDEDDREFTIRIDVSLPVEEMISTIMHELVHAHQYLSGRLKHLHNDLVRYEGVLYNWYMDYDSRPWEIEAHAKEKQLKEIWDEQERY